VPPSALSGLLGDRVRPILGSLRSVPVPTHHTPDKPLPAAEPFITISREAGLGSADLTDRLIRALNNLPASADRPWACWDRELVEKVATDHKLSSQLIESLEETDRTWLTDLLSSLTYGDDADETKVYHRVAQTIRALAQAGRVIIVGRGSVFVTRDMPGGIHVRLVAPQSYRLLRVAEEQHTAPDAAAAQLRELERRRNAFHRRHWPEASLGAETFDVTFNAARMDAAQMAAALLPLVRARLVAK
jgi:cytidylate kinase